MSHQVPTDMGELLKWAMQREIEAYKFYDLLYQKATNKEARKRLETLREDEKRHEATLRELYRKCFNQEVGELPAMGDDQMATMVKQGHLDELKSEIEFINLAIDAETAAMKFYKEAAQKAEDGELKDMLDRLSDEESTHYDILMAERHALSGNYYWFSTGDTSPMED